jgi:uncharacterized membrane protein YphA (DoxX/SURF4 family)
MNRSLTTYFKWILSFIFVAAGILKMFSPDNTGDILIFFFNLDYSLTLIIVYSIAIIELILGILLFSGYAKRYVRSTVIFFCSVFLMIAILGYSNSWQFACGCFGKFSFGKFDAAMVLRNTLLLGMSLWITFDTSKFKNLILRGSLTNNNK